MASRNQKDWSFTIFVLAVVMFMCSFIIGLPMKNQYEEHTSAISPRAEPQLFATTMSGSLDSIEANTIGVSMPGSFFVVKHAGNHLFFVNNVESDSGVTVEAESEEDGGMIIPLGKALSFYGSEFTGSKYHFVVRVKHPRYSMTCVVEALNRRSSYGMTVYCT